MLTFLASIWMSLAAIATAPVNSVSADACVAAPDGLFQSNVVLSGPSQVCPNQEVTYTVTVSSGVSCPVPYQYNWGSYSGSFTTLAGGGINDNFIRIRFGASVTNMSLWITVNCSSLLIGTNVIQGITTGTFTAPTTTGASRCSPGAVTLHASTTVSGAVIRWYEQASGGSVIATGTSFTTPSLTNSKTYYVSAYNPTTGCEGIRGAVTATINPIPTIPTIDEGYSCSDASIVLYANKFGGPNVRWYAAFSGGSVLAESRGFTTPVLSATKTYYAASYDVSTGCENGYRIGATATIVKPAIASAPDKISCGPGSVVLQATPVAPGDVIRWYESSSGGTPFLTASSFTTPVLSSSRTYYVSAFNATYSCENAVRTPLLASVNAIPSTAVVSGGKRMGPGNVLLTSTTGAVCNWYRGSDNALLGTGTTFTTGSVNGSLPHYIYARAFQAGCESVEQTWVDIDVSPLPVITGPAHLSLGGAQLDAGNGYTTYQWKSSAGQVVGNERFFKATIADTYTVIVTKIGYDGSGISAPFTLGRQVDDQNLNYVITNSILIDQVTDENAVDALPVQNRSQNIQYFDGLGRLMQTVETQGSPDRLDVVAPVVYDEFGRVAREYLPYTTQEDNGRYKPQPVGPNSPQSIFYNDPTNTVADDQRPYSETAFDRSPLNRPREQYGPGYYWSTKFVGQQDFVNGFEAGNEAEKIVAWKIDATGMPVRRAALQGFIQQGGYYSTGQLKVNVTKDEHKNAVREYIDKNGRIVLRKIQTKSDVTDPEVYDDWAMTYYIYDQLGHQVYVLQPELSKKIHQSDSYIPTPGDLDNFAFQYKYDSRNRVVQKRVPGADWLYLVYDPRDRLVMTQDGVQRSIFPREWLVTKYDYLDRPILTGIVKDNFGWTLDFVQNYVNDFYSTADSGDGSAWYEDKAGSIHGYTNRTYPTFLLESDYNTATYYDDYWFKQTLASPASYDFNATHVSGQLSASESKVKGLVTGTKVRVLDGEAYGQNSWRATINYYDNKYRLIQAVSDNDRGGLDRITNIIDFTGRILTTFTTQQDQLVHWEKFIQAAADGGKVVKNEGADNDWNSAAFSSQTLPANASGWIEALGSEQSSYRMFGLASQDPGVNINGVNYALVLRGAGNLVVLEGGNPVYSNGSYGSGAILRIEKAGTQVLYKVNGLTIYTSTVHATTSLTPVALFYSRGATVANTRTSFANTNHSVRHDMTYDHAGRLINEWHTVDNSSKILLAHHEYNELGQLITKKLYNTDPPETNDSQRSYQQVVDMRYTIRGGLSRINRSDLAADNAADPTDYFGMNLYYNENSGITGVTSQFNGNISAMQWSANLGLGTVKQHAHVYAYDAMNRLTAADFKVNENGNWGLPNTTDSNGNTISVNAFSEKNFEYDLNGNIKKLSRSGKAGEIDQLKYEYGNFGNQLQFVDDLSFNEEGFKDDQDAQTDDYGYDMNGRMILDRNKNIRSIKYNYLNLPVLVVNATGDSIRYIYDAMGTKLRQVVGYKNPTKRATYSHYGGLFFHQGDTLKFINHDEGRVVMTGTEPEYQYFMKDHLGNVRMTFTTKEESEMTAATMETASATTESEQYLNYNEAVTLNSKLFDHTSDGEPFRPDKTYNSILLRGENASVHEKYGLARSLSVMPGDVINMEVFAKYIDPSGQPINQELIDAIAAIGNGSIPGGALIDAGTVGSLGAAAFPFANLLTYTDDPENSAPHASLNWLIFDRDHKFKDGGSQPITTAAAVDRYGNGTHEHLSHNLVVQEPGYVYIYLSNENESLADVLFDDFKVELIKSSIVQMEDYYPFGLTFNSYSRENSITQNYRYNGKELQSDLNLGWLDYGAREYMPDIGRWSTIDPLAEVAKRWSSYAYAYNNPITFIDPDGMLARYNWNTGQYEEEDGTVVPWNYVANQINSGAYDQSTPGKNFVAIAAYNEEGKDKNAFEQRKKGFNADRSYTVHTGKSFIESLITASKGGAITRLIVASHGSGAALYMNKNAGMYGDSFDEGLQTGFSAEEGAATLADLAKRIKSGDIVFADDAQIFFVGCNTADYWGIGIDSFAEEFSEIVPNAYVTGSTQKSSPSPKEVGSGKNTRKIDSNNYASRGHSAWYTYQNGVLVKKTKGVINPTTKIVKQSK